MTDGMGYAAVFELGVRCHNCRKHHVSHLAIPDEEGAPTSVDELLESAFLTDIRFRCTRCDGSIGSIITVKTDTAKVEAADVA